MESADINTEQEKDIFIILMRRGISNTTDSNIIMIMIFIRLNIIDEIARI
ncbi:hypothetical protein ATR01nite_29670 [Acetobacter tropicalis]|uniref:Uncharacterized protein n=1 Tax=Acetobacter tropicalis TaxID=104102 RepID=A0A511FSF8_9PROT|nr:hypothetical protein ATR01nite_29670 [Acetobacter tropicalis]